MKNYILPLLIALFAFVGHVNAQTSYSMVVEKNDGGKVTIPTADIKQISFEENTDNPSLFQGPKRIFGNNQLKAMGCYSDYDGSERYEFTYNDKGYVTKIHRIRHHSTEDYIFEYNSDGILLYVWDDGTLEYIYTLMIGENGFVSDFSADEGYSYVYNDKDQLISIIEKDINGSETQELTWLNGNIIREEENHEDYPCPTYISYTTPSSDAIENIAGVMEYDDGMGVEMDEFFILYYAGFLGKGTKQLPQTWTEQGKKDYSKKGKNTWTLDSAGRAIKLVNEQEENGYSSTHTETKTFYWEW